MELKREVTKYIRDAAKADYKYKKKDKCEICNTQKDLELHHYYSISLLIEKWLKTTKYLQENVLDWRDEFINLHRKEIYDEVVTLCNFHHQHRLHVIYGQIPSLNTAEKQKKWVETQKRKNESIK